MNTKIVARVAAVFAAYLVVEAASLAGLTVLQKLGRASFFPSANRLSPKARANLAAFVAQGEGREMRMDPNLGWSPAPTSPETNGAGMRDDREYARTPSPGVLRIAAFGDSFTYGDDVPLADAWAKQVSARTRSIEVLNYGVPAYGLDQAYLRYLAVGADYRPDMVFIGYMSENLARDVNVFRAFYSPAYQGAIFTKPRFWLDGDALVEAPNPLRTVDAYRALLDDESAVLRAIGANDYHYVACYSAGPFDFSPTVRLAKIAGGEVRKATQIPIFARDGSYDLRSEAYRVTVRIFDAFYRAVLERGALPVIVVLPDWNDQRRSRNGMPRRYASLLADLSARGYRVLDTLDAIERVEDRYSIDDLSVEWGHFSRLANGIVAAYIVERLGELKLDTRASVEAAAAAERIRLTVTQSGDAR